MKRFQIQPLVLSNLFINLSSAWFGIILISPFALIEDSLFLTIVTFTKAIGNGILFLIAADYFARKDNT